MNRQNNETRRTVLRRTAGRAAVAVLLAACMLASGCAKEFEEVTGGAGGGKRIEVSFETPQMDELHVGTRAETDELAINDIWVLQFNAGGTALLQPAVYFSPITANRVVIELQEQESMIYFIANTGDGTLLADIATAAQVDALTTATTAESECYQNGIPMGARLKGLPSELDFGRVLLVRAVAKLKIDIKLNTLGSFTISDCKVYNVPREVTYYRDPDKLDPGTTASAPYPATSKVMTNASWYTIPLTKKYNGPFSGTCYLPENCRGKGTATRQEDKTAAKALGGASGQGNYATYLELTGDYTTNDGTVFKNNKYRIYLGGDEVSDYNVKRNTYYTITATILGINKLDARVTVGTPTYPGDYYDYTDNRTGRFLIAKSDATNGTAVNWNAGQKLCKDGWRLPTALEIGLSATLAGDWWKIYYGFKSQWYHTSSFNGATSNQRFAFNYSTWSYGVGPTSDNAHVRCVKDLPSDGKKYPYVTTDKEGKKAVIVLREGSNGVKSGVIRSRIYNTETNINSFYESTIKLPTKLQVATSDQGYDYYQWKTIVGICDNYSGQGYTDWRVPNQREALLIAMMMDELEIPKYGRIYTCATWGRDDYRTGTYIIPSWPLSTVAADAELSTLYNQGTIGLGWNCVGCRKTKGCAVCVRDA